MKHFCICTALCYIHNHSHRLSCSVKDAKFVEKPLQHALQVGFFFGRHTSHGLCVCPNYILKTRQKIIRVSSIRSSGGTAEKKGVKAVMLFSVESIKSRKGSWKTFCYWVIIRSEELTWICSVSCTVTSPKPYRNTAETA